MKRELKRDCKPNGAGAAAPVLQSVQRTCRQAAQCH